MRVLIIGSLAGPLGAAARIAVGRGAKLDQCETVELGLIRLRGPARIDVVLCDLSQDLAGLVRALSTERMSVPVVACGVNVSAHSAAQAIRDGACEFLPLPPQADLITAILEAVSSESHTLVARDPAMLETLRRAEQVAGADASILVLGESGTGKEILARHIHRRSRRNSGPFVALNCAAIPENLLESELFGHEKGAFSGAVARRIGKFEAAEGGTLLLDEISEMDIRLQAKLLRALQEREIDRLGGSGPVRVNVRILATSNRDLLQDVAHGRFREDLYFRLNVIALHIPPLRERPQDIAALADHFARKYADVNGVPYRRLTDAAFAQLKTSPWRGNVRELENSIHRAVLLATGEMIDVEALAIPAVISSNIPNTPSSASCRQTVEPVGDMAALVGRRMEDVERDFIIQTLHHTFGNRTHAATILGISIRALRNKLRDYAAHGAAVPPPGVGVIA
jgi:two-component system response regulator FlrC